MIDASSRIDFNLNKAIARLEPSTEAKADAEILLAFVLKKNRTYLLAWPEKELQKNELDSFWHLIEQRMLGKPIAYLTGYQEFWSRDFCVTPSVLIPRPETERLIELALEIKPSNILDLGTGSGAIGITLALELPDSKVIATDFSENALCLARLNAQRLHVKNINFLQGDWFEAIPKNSCFDLIVSNPPYVSENDPHLKNLKFEPITALSSGKEGLDALDKIIQDGLNHLQKEAWLMLEHGFDQAERVRRLLSKAGFRCIRSYKDLQGHERITIGQSNHEFRTDKTT